MQRKPRSLAEITEVERAYIHGVPTLGHAASELLLRWQYPLRDAETFLRLAFLAWYREHEPEWLTGVEVELPSVQDLVAETGGESMLDAEACFTLALLWNIFPPAGEEEGPWRARARELAERAAKLEPSSRLFRAWRYFLGQAEETGGARLYIEAEVHARYQGRGAMGEYVGHMLTERLQRGRCLRK